MKRFLLRFGFLINLACAVPLLLAYLSTRISPDTFWPIAFFGLFFPVWLALNVFFLAVWAFLKPKYLFLPVLVLVIGIGHLRAYIGMSPFARNQPDKGMRVMTYNVKNFDLYNWTENHIAREGIIGFLEQAQPDILCLQEFYQRSGHPRYENVEALKGRLGLKYAWIQPKVWPPHNQIFGQAIFSRYPIIDKGTVELPHTWNHALWADLLADGDTIRVFSIHLQSIYLGADGEGAVERFLSDQETDLEQGRIVLSKLKRGFMTRAEQARVLAEAIGQSPYPVLVCGDFNDTPVSYAYRTIARGLKDAYARKHLHIGPTFAGRIPWLRIDYILTSKDFRIHSSQRHAIGWSDHFPVEATLSLQ